MVHLFSWVPAAGEKGEENSWAYATFSSRAQKQDEQNILLCSGAGSLVIVSQTLNKSARLSVLSHLPSLSSFFVFFFALSLPPSHSLLGRRRGRLYKCETTHAVSMFAGIIRDNVGQYREECSNLNSLCSAPTATQKPFTDAQIHWLWAGATALLRPFADSRSSKGISLESGMFF